MSLATPYYVLGIILMSITQIPPFVLLVGCLTSGGFSMIRDSDSIMLCGSTLGGILAWLLYHKNDAHAIKESKTNQIFHLACVYGAIWFYLPILACIPMALQKNNSTLLLTMIIYVSTNWILPLSSTVDVLVPICATYVEWAISYYYYTSLAIGMTKD